MLLFSKQKSKICIISVVGEMQDATNANKHICRKCTPTSQNHAHFVPILWMCEFLCLFISCDLGGDLDGNSDDHLWAHVKSEKIYSFASMCIGFSWACNSLECANRFVVDCMSMWMPNAVRKKLRMHVPHLVQPLTLPLLPVSTYFREMREEKTTRNELTAKTLLRHSGWGW